VKTTRVDEAQDILRQMAAIRHELNENVEEVVQNAKELVDWRNFVRAHPWLTVSAAAAVGFLLVPRRWEGVRPDADALAELVRRDPLAVNWKPQPTRAGIVGPFVNFLAGAALRSLMTAAGHYAVRMMSGVSREGGPEGSAASCQTGQSLHGNHELAHPSARVHDQHV
jgi:hypothetical protein